MKTGDAAKRLGISNKTVMNWTERFQEFMSDGAKPGAGLQRDYNTDDLHVLNTILLETNRGTSWVAIDDMLQSGTRHKDLPPETAILPGESAIMVSQKMAEIVAENKMLIQRLQDSEERSEAKDRRIEKLLQENAVLKYRLDQIENDDDE